MSKISNSDLDMTKNQYIKNEMQINLCKLSTRAIMKYQVGVPFMMKIRVVGIPCYFTLGKLNGTPIYYNGQLDRTV